MHDLSEQDLSEQADVARGAKERRPGRPRVVIVGGGFGGIEVAKALSSAPLDILLIDRINYHLFQPLLYQVAMAGLSPAEIAAPIRAVLSAQQNVRVLLGEVVAIDLDGRSVRTREVSHPYDWLVVAAGAENSYFGHAGWEAHAPGLKTVEDALEIRRRVLYAFERAERAADPAERKRCLTFAVIGGGPTGVELSGAIAELARFSLSRDFRNAEVRDTRVVLIEAGPRILAAFPEALARAAERQLEELGVEVRIGARVTAIDEGGVTLESAAADDLPGLGRGPLVTKVPAATVLWGAGVAASGLGRTLGVPLDRQGRVIVGQDASLPGHPEAFVIGDMARFEADGEPLPGVSPVAMQQGRYVARLIADEAQAGPSRGKRAPFRYRDKGSMATIGRSRAIAWVDNLQLHGFLAWLAWLFVHVFYLIGFANRVVVVFRWFLSYVAYGRGARLITETGWRPAADSPKPSPPALAAAADNLIPARVLDAAAPRTPR